MLLQKKKQMKLKKIFPVGVAHIKTSNSNTIVSFSDLLGNIICWASAGTLHNKNEKFKNAKKGTPYAAQIAAKNAAEKAISFGIKTIGVILKGEGKGNGRENSLRALKISGLNIMYIEDNTPLAHNGCRAPKRRKL